jgi:lipopolysaccharide transport system permease protein
MFYYHYLPHLAGLLILPLLLVITFMAAVGGGFFLSSLNVKYRDVRYILPFFIQLMLFATPVIYPASIAGKYSKILALNPMTGVIKAAQAAILGNAPINWTLLAISGIVCLAVFIFGIIYFKLTEKYFADVI